MMSKTLTVQTDDGETETVSRAEGLILIASGKAVMATPEASRPTPKKRTSKPKTEKATAPSVVETATE